MIVEKMLEATKDLWEGFYQHPFVKGIADGSLSDERFRHYLVQDTLYLKEYARTYYIGAAKEEDVNIMLFMSKVGDGMIANDEDVNKRNLRRLGVEIDSVYQTPMSLDNLSYVSYMEKVAYKGGTAEALAAVMPCGLSYEYLAKRMVEENPKCLENEKYGDFIGNYIRDQFCDNNAKYIELIEKLAENYSEEQIDNLVEIFVRCAEYEMRFWDLSWEIQ